MALLRQNSGVSFPDQNADDEFENLFDQYVAGDTLDTENHMVETGFVGAEVSALRMRVPGAAGPGRARRLELEQPWQMAQWHQIAALPLADAQGGNFTFYKESSGRAAISDGELLSLGGRSPQIQLPVPSPSPPTPSPSHSAPTLTERTEDLAASPRNVCRDPATRRKHRKNSRTPTMDRVPATYQREAWSQRYSSPSATPNLQVPPTTLPCTPPPSTGRQTYSNDLTKGEASNECFGHNSRRISSQDRQYSIQPSPTVVLQRPGMSQRPVSNDYTHGATHPSSSTQSFVPPVSPYHTSGSSVFGHPASSGFESSNQHWEYPTQAVSGSQPSQSTYQIGRLGPQQGRKSLMQFTREYDSPMLDNTATIANTGLMIHGANTPSPEDHPMTGMGEGNSSTYFSASAEDVMAILTPDTSPQGHSFDRVSSRQPHLSVSPVTPPSRSPSRSPGPHGHCRRSSKTLSGSSRVRKHSNGGGYSSGQQTRTPSNEQIPNLSRARKHSSGSGYSNGQPRSPTGDIVFQNFTADDSDLILSGVAPSGSSKTKERREREAREKRRKYSEMLLEHVRKAGGDAEMLRRGLLSET
ncbi:MAG: hypothetical protein M1840_009164 [Geoglossum simile]|nr:MAG: hypothetical protein M1840_009164 [Geoglossum simile]